MALLWTACSKSEIQIGDKAPEFSLPDLSGQVKRFDPGLKRIKILYFWADWCPRCSEDFVQLERLYQRWKKEPQGPLLISIDVGQSPEHVKAFVKKHGVTFPVLLDQEGQIARRYGIKGLPTYFIIDRQGRIRFVILGWAEEKVLWDYLKRLSSSKE